MARTLKHSVEGELFNGKAEYSAGSIFELMSYNELYHSNNENIEQIPESTTVGKKWQYSVYEHNSATR